MHPSLVRTHRDTLIAADCKPWNSGLLEKQGTAFRADMFCVAAVSNLSSVVAGFEDPGIRISSSCHVRLSIFSSIWRSSTILTDSISLVGSCRPPAVKLSFGSLPF